jgi:hypothetical protein
VGFAVISLAAMPANLDFCGVRGSARCKIREEQRKTAKRTVLHIPIGAQKTWMAGQGSDGPYSLRAAPE